jgi:hypothetical protein
MIQLKVPTHSTMDNNLEDHFHGYMNDKEWEAKIKSLPYVKDVVWVNTGSIGTSHTLITFKNEAHKTWFVLRWS